MKKLILFISLIILTLTSTYSQDCEYSENKIDEFTKANIKTTKNQTVSNMHNVKTYALHFSLSKYNDSKSLNLIYESRFSSANTCFNQDSKLLFMTTNDSVISLKYNGEVNCAKSEIISNQYGAYTNHWLFGSFDLNVNSFEQLKNSKIKKVRIYFVEGYEDIEINEKVKAPLGGFKRQGNKRINPQEYFIKYLACIE